MALFYPRCRAIISAVFDGFGGNDSDPNIFQVVPKSASVNLNGYKEADTWSLEFDAKQFPFSPEIIRSLAVEIYMFQVAGAFDDEEKFAADEPLVTGLLDESTLHYGDDGRTFRMSGRDYTALMLDQTWPVNKKVPVGLPLDQTVQQIVDDATQKNKTGRTLTVQFLPDFEHPILGRTPETVTRKKVKISPTTGKGHGKSNRRGFPVKSGRNYWDVIYALCLRHGFITFVRNNDVIITTPQTLTEQTAQKAVRMAYGRNLSSLEIERHMGKDATPTVIVTSYDPATQQTIRGQYPPAGKTKIKTTGIGTKKDEFRIVSIAGVTDPAQLQACAETYYNNLARSETRSKFETQWLTDLDGRDLFKFRPGDPVGIEFDPFDGDEMRRLTVAERYSYLIRLGYSPAVADLVSREFEMLDLFQLPRQCRNATFEYDHESGVSVSVEVMNYNVPQRDDPRFNVAPAQGNS